MTLQHRGAAVTPRPVILVALAACVAALAGCGAGGEADRAGGAPVAAGHDDGRAMLAQVGSVTRVLAEEGASVDDAREVRFGALAARAWTVDGPRAACVLIAVSSPSQRTPVIATQCGRRDRRQRRGLVSTMGDDGSRSASVYGLAPDGARKAIVVGARTTVVAVRDGRFGVVAQDPRYVQFVTGRGLTPRVTATVGRS
jgi:hypothetical protein